MQQSIWKFFSITLLAIGILQASRLAHADGCGGIPNCVPFPTGKICGNGFLDPGEECDRGDQNGQPGIDCNASCNIVPASTVNFSCYGEAHLHCSNVRAECENSGGTNCMTDYAACVHSAADLCAHCGDGKPDEGESCDDGANNGPNQWCGNTCSFQLSDQIDQGCFSPKTGTCEQKKQQCVADNGGNCPGLYMQCLKDAADGCRFNGGDNGETATTEQIVAATPPKASSPSSGCSLAPDTGFAATLPLDSCLVLGAFLLGLIRCFKKGC